MWSEDIKRNSELSERERAVTSIAADDINAAGVRVAVEYEGEDSLLIDRLLERSRGQLGIAKPRPLRYAYLGQGPHA